MFYLYRFVSLPAFVLIPKSIRVLRAALFVSVALPLKVLAAFANVFTSALELDFRLDACSRLDEVFFSIFGPSQLCKRFRNSRKNSWEKS